MRMKRRCLLAIVLIIHASNSLGQEQPTRLAVLDLVSQSIPEGDVWDISAILRRELSGLPQFEVLSRYDTYTPLISREIEGWIDCHSAECISRIGRELVVELTVGGSIELDKEELLHLEAQLVDVAMGRRLRMATASAKDTERLSKELQHVARDLAGIPRDKGKGALWVLGGAVVAGAGAAAALMMGGGGDGGTAPIVEPEEGAAEITAVFPSQ